MYGQKRQVKHNYLVWSRRSFPSKERLKSQFQDPLSSLFWMHTHNIVSLWIRVVVTLKATAKLSRASEKTHVVMLIAISCSLVPKHQPDLFHASPPIHKYPFLQPQKFGIYIRGVTHHSLQQFNTTCLKEQMSHMNSICPPHPTCSSGPDSYCQCSQQFPPPLSHRLSQQERNPWEKQTSLRAASQGHQGTSCNWFCWDKSALCQLNLELSYEREWT